MIKGKKQIRILDIAKKANVSIGTVDRVLYNRGGVKEETKNRVLEVIKELDYKPNMLAKSLALKKNYKIYILIPDSENNNYWKKPLIGIKQATAEFKYFNLELETLIFDLASENDFKEKVDFVLKNPPDGIVFMPVFKESALMFSAQLDNKNIPYSFMDVNLSGVNNLSFVGQNAKESGKVAARLMNYAVAGNSKVLVVEIFDRDYIPHHINNRVKSFMENLRASEKNIEVCESFIDLSTVAEPDVVLSNSFEKYKNIAGIFVPNSRSYLVARYLEKTGLNKKILIGYDLTDDNIEYLKKDYIDFLINQKPEEQAYKAIKSLFDYILLNKKERKDIYVPIEIIVKENINYTNVKL